VNIVVDGDSCPVKEEIAATARTFAVPVLMVASFDHLIQESDGVSVARVDRSSQSADLFIANHIVSGDIVITQDYGLAALAIAKCCDVLSPRGEIYDAGNIDYLLERRHVQAKARRAGRHSKGPRPFTDEDRQHFQQKLTKLLERRQEIGCS
jgi:uncharacterized protein